MRRIDFGAIFWLALLMGFLFFITYLFAYGKSEGNMGSGFFVNFIADSVIAFAYPTILLFPSIFYEPGWLMLLSIFINCLLYSLAIERIIWVIKYLRRHKSKFVA